jgi:hypothetical protein
MSDALLLIIAIVGLIAVIIPIWGFQKRGLDKDKSV